MRPQQAFFFSQNNTLSTPDQEKQCFRCKKKISPLLYGVYQKILSTNEDERTRQPSSSSAPTLRVWWQEDDG